ncbi:MAG: hypothetical protein IIU45_06335 [Lachnospiraceae bacterium]|nr:hypothetical protein [Lachnospiraceae bacterium]
MVAALMVIMLIALIGMDIYLFGYFKEKKSGKPAGKKKALGLVFMGVWLVSFSLLLAVI